MTEKSEVANLSAQPRYNFDRRTTTANGVNDIWAIDLVDLSRQKAGYILNCVDIFSRYAQAVKLREKTTEELERGITELFRLFGSKPKNIWCDKESAVRSLDTWLTSHGVHLYHVENSYTGPDAHGVGIVERFNRTMNFYMKLYRQQNRQQNYTQLSVYTIKKFIPEYNNKIHSTTQRTPNEVYHGQHAKEVMSNQTRRANERKIEGKKLRLGQQVHIQKKEDRKHMRPKFEDNYEREKVEINGVKLTNPITYTVKGKGDTGFYSKQFL